MNERIASLADDALNAKERVVTRRAPSQLGPFSLDDGYAVAAAVDERLRLRGWRRVGRKLAFTDQSLWQKLGVDEPAWGYIYDRTVVHVDEGDRPIALDGFVAPRLETEIVFGLRGAPMASARADEIAACVEWAALGFEIIDCHYPDWRFRPGDALADLVLHGALLIGSPHQFTHESEAVAWARGLEAAGLTTRRGDEHSVAGSPRAVLGNPLTALGRLPELVARHGGELLRAGEIVTTGTMTAPFDLGRGDVCTADITKLDLPPLRVRFA